jgi:signal transduction histidine kinase
VESVLKFQQGTLRKAAIELQTKMVYAQPIYAFPGELRQVVTNLVSNAVEAMQRNGKLFVRVHPARDWRNGQVGYRILVADSGHGISQETSKRLFDAFYTTKGDNGTGLGLWIINQLVQKHGGYIRFRSRGQSTSRSSGTLFTVFLPLVHDFTNADASIGMNDGNAVT